MHLVELLVREFLGERIDSLPGDGGEDGLPEILRQLLSGGERLPRHAVPGAALLFHYDQYAAHMTRTSNLSFSTSLRGGLLGVAFEDLGLFGFLRDVDALENRSGFRRGAEFADGDAADLLALGFLDAHEGGVAEFVDARLDGEDGGQRHVDVLEPAVFEFALDADGGAVHFHLHDDGGVRDAEEFGEHDAGLAVAEIVRLEAGEDAGRDFRP